jgi:hypothetical protein
MSAHTVATPSDPEVDFDDRVQKSFDFLQDVTKQVITLATAIFTFSVAFLKDFAQTAGADARFLLTIAWIAFIASTVLGIVVLLSMTGMLGRKEAKRDIYSSGPRIFSFLQLLTFGAALVFLFLFGVTWT